MTIFIAPYPKALMRFTIWKNTNMVAWRMELLCYMYTKEGQKIESYHFLRILTIGTNISISFCRENTVGKYNGQ